MASRQSRAGGGAWLERPRFGGIEASRQVFSASFFPSQRRSLPLIAHDRIFFYSEAFRALMWCHIRPSASCRPVGSQRRLYTRPGEIVAWAVHGARHPGAGGLDIRQFPWHVDGCMAQLVLGFPFNPPFQFERLSYVHVFLPYVFAIMPLSVMPFCDPPSSTLVIGADVRSSCPSTHARAPVRCPIPCPYDRDCPNTTRACSTFPFHAHSKWTPPGSRILNRGPRQKVMRDFLKGIQY